MEDKNNQEEENSLLWLLSALNENKIRSLSGFLPDDFHWSRLPDVIVETSCPKELSPMLHQLGFLLECLYKGFITYF